MVEMNFDDDDVNLHRVAASTMTVGSVLLGLAGLVWAVGGFWTLGRVELPAGWAVGLFAVVVALSFVWWAVALLLWGAARLIRLIDDLRSDLNASLRENAETALVGRRRPSEPTAIDQLGQKIEQLIALTREMRDVSLLSEHERNLRARTESASLIEQLKREIPVLLREHNWQEARARVQQAQMRFPSLSAWDALAEDVEQARAKYESHDIENSTREIDELIALQAWDRATNAALELQHRHPNSDRAAEIGRRVAAQREKATAEERTRLMARAQDATNRRDWVEALRLVEDILERFPRSLEARDLRQQLPTLQANSEIQTRQRMESEIRDLIQQKRYIDALRRTQTLLGRYPDSPQAAVLREQLPKLEKKAGLRS